MKRLVALLIVVAFVAGLAAVAFADASPAEIRVYIRQLNGKLAVAKKAGDRARVNKLTQMIAVQNKRLAEAEAAEMAPPPPPSRVAPPPPPPRRVAPPPPEGAGMLGMGVNTSVEIGLIAGMVGLTGNVLLEDPMGIGPMIGLPANAVQWKLGLGYAQGKDTNSNDWKCIPLIIDGVINLPADVMGGVESFVGGGLNYVIYRTGQTGGSYGVQAYVGIQGDMGLGLGGKTYGEVGYSILRTGTSDKGAYSSKSVTVLVGQKILL